MIEFVGWLGGILFAICALPQAIMTFKQGKAREISWLFLLMWLFGEIFTLAYVLPKSHLPLIVNYIGNILLIMFIISYKIWEDK